MTIADQTDVSTLTGPPTLADAPPADTDDAAVALRTRLTTALALLAAPLLVLSNVLLPSLPGDARQVVDTIAPITERLLAVQLLYAVASVCFVPFVVAVWRLRARRGSIPRLVGGGVVILGMTANGWSEAVKGYLTWAMAGAGVEPAAQARTLSELDALPESLPISWWVIPFTVAGLVVLAIGIARARVVPLWAPLALVAGTVAMSVSGTGPRSLVGLVMVAGATGCIVRSDRHQGRPAA